MSRQSQRLRLALETTTLKLNSVMLTMDASYPKDPDPEHWRTISGAHVHLDKNGNYNGGAGGKFNGHHHWGPDWREKSYFMNRLASALHSGVAKGKAQGNTQNKNVAPNATNGQANSSTITSKEKAKIKEIENLHNVTEKARQEANPRRYDLGKPDEYQKYLIACKKRDDAIAQENKARSEATAQGIPLVSRSWCKFEEEFKTNNIANVAVTRHVKQPSEAEIIDNISGGDKTKGSCASVAFAYIANKCGLNALDFRGGASMTLFSRKWTKQAMLDFPGIKGQTIQHIPKAPASTGASMLLGLEKGKEYYLSFGGHASIIKNTTEGVKYLELQSPYPNGNGWQLMGKDKQMVSKKLQSRFGAPARAPKRYLCPLTLLEVDSFKGNREFEKIVEYFNTNKGDQKKGANGSVK